MICSAGNGMLFVFTFTLPILVSDGIDSTEFVFRSHPQIAQGGGNVAKIFLLPNYGCFIMQLMCALSGYAL